MGSNNFGPSIWGKIRILFISRKGEWILPVGLLGGEFAQLRQGHDYNVFWHLTEAFLICIYSHSWSYSDSLWSWKCWAHENVLYVVWWSFFLLPSKGSKFTKPCTSCFCRPSTVPTNKVWITCKSWPGRTGTLICGPSIRNQNDAEIARRNVTLLLTLYNLPSNILATTYRLFSRFSGLKIKNYLYNHFARKIILVQCGLVKFAPAVV